MFLVLLADTFFREMPGVAARLSFILFAGRMSGGPRGTLAAGSTSLLRHRSTEGLRLQMRMLQVQDTYRAGRALDIQLPTAQNGVVALWQPLRRYGPWAWPLDKIEHSFWSAV